MKAKTLTPDELERVLAACDLEERALILVTHKAALRSCEVSALSWPMLLDASGNLADSIDLPAVASKGRTGAGRIPLSPSLRTALYALWHDRGYPTSGVVFGRAGSGAMNAEALARRVGRIYDRVFGTGCHVTSHSGRRTALTTLIRGGMALADAKKFARHVDEKTTLRYCDAADNETIAAAVSKLG